ncbi:MAG: hypothetical protein OEZ01_10215 [Candidatus Heimdallarchaeota archaeon]|nr:hypothetical protein [Candidatus Heimdallarchaeota archaeon]MDH5646373.1 hypothetical protein [Candidatus Heimdallarchaeota archaeon]
MEKLSFPLERSPAMRLLGYLMTGNLLGQILILVLFSIGFFFMVNQEFNLISLFFFSFFILPMSYLFHKRFVSKGKSLMYPWCEVIVVNDQIKIKSGFPNTMNPGWQIIDLSEITKNILIKGDDESGYFLQLSGDNIPFIRLGLWINKIEAISSAEKLATLINGIVVGLN